MISLRRIAGSSALRALDLGVQVLTTLWLTPVIIRSLGQERYGLWITVITLVTYIDIFDLGLTSAVTRYVSRGLGKNDPDYAAEVVRSAFTLLLQIGLACLLLVFGLAAVAPLFLRDAARWGSMPTMILIFGVVSALSFPLRVFAGVLEAHLRYELTTGMSILRTLLTSVALWWVATHSGELLHIVVVVTVGGLFQRSLNYLGARRVFPQMRLWPLGTEPEVRRDLLDYGWKNFLLKLIDVFRFRIDNVVIARCVGVNAVSLYAPGMSLIRYWNEAVSSLAAVFMPVFSLAEGAGDRDQLRAHFFSAMKATTALATFVGGTLVLYGGYFIERWLGPEFRQSYRVVLVLAPAVVLGLSQLPGVFLLFSLSKQHRLLRMNAIEAVANLVLSLWLVWHWGIFGVAAGTAISLFFSKVFIQPAIICPEVGLTRWCYFGKGILAPMAMVLASMLLMHLLLAPWVRADYGRLLVAVAAQVIAVAPVAWWMWRAERPTQTRLRKDSPYY